MSIPKIVFQTSIHKPEQYIIDKILSKCVGWTYIHYNDEEIIKYFKENYIEEFKDIINKFHNMPSGAHKSDLFRYYYLYVTGGVYIDSDAMIEMNIENIIKDYSFVSVDSTYVCSAIFQGFICSTPNHIIIYKALQDAYNINVHELSRNYHLLCRNLYNIIKNNDAPNINLYLYKEKSYDSWTAQSYNDDNKIILLHYYHNKRIPR
jgi:mannosyltransferase OCH1-like enzyme